MKNDEEKSDLGSEVNKIELIFHGGMTENEKKAIAQAIENVVQEKIIVNNPKELKIKSTTNQIELKWKLGTEAQKTQLQEKSGNTWVTKVYDGTTLSYVKDNLKAGTTTSFRIRSYKKVNGIKRYSTWNYFDVATKPQPTEIKSISTKNNKIKVKWKKIKNSTGYQVQYSTDKDFKVNSKKINVTGKTKTSIKLTSGQKYYIRIRSYITASNVKNYSTWSSVKSKKL